MILVALVLAAALPQDGEKLRKFERTFSKDDKDDRTSSGDGRKEKRQEHGHGGHWQDPFPESHASEYSLADFFFYPVIDHGRRFEDFPYAESAWYFSTDRLTDKPLAVRADFSVGRIEHDLWSVDFDGTLSWSSGCDLRINVTQLMEDVAEGTDRLTLHQYQLNFGGTAGPRNVNFSIGFGLSAIDGEEVSDAGPSLQGGFVWYPSEPWSVRVGMGLVKFSEASLADLWAEAGYHVGRFEVTAGIRSLISSGGESLTGPTLGFAVHF